MLTDLGRSFQYALPYFVGSVAMVSVAELVPVGVIHYALWIVGGILFFVACYMLWQLHATAENERQIGMASEARAGVEALSRLLGSFPDAPNQHKWELLRKAAPEYGLEGIEYLPTLILQKDTETDAMQYEWPEHLARRVQWERLAQDYFDKTHALPYGYYTENGIGNNKIFTVSQFKEILHEIVVRGLGEKDAQNGETSLFPEGESLLRHFYPTSPTPPPDYTSLNTRH